MIIGILFGGIEQVQIDKIRMGIVHVIAHMIPVFEQVLVPVMPLGSVPGGRCDEDLVVFESIGCLPVGVGQADRLHVAGDGGEGRVRIASALSLTGRTGEKKAGKKEEEDPVHKFPFFS
jgi:hypothetical protein